MTDITEAEIDRLRQIVGLWVDPSRSVLMGEHLHDLFRSLPRLLGEIEVLSAEAERLSALWIAETRQIERIESERNGWMETASLHLKNENYYRGLVQLVGKLHGDAAYISDDGSRQQDILCAKVPELAEAALRARDEALAQVAKMRPVIEAARVVYEVYDAERPTNYIAWQRLWFAIDALDGGHDDRHHRR